MSLQDACHVFLEGGVPTIGIVGYMCKVILLVYYIQKLKILNNKMRLLIDRVMEKVIKSNN